eukprot:7032422-Prymnesium_polylepis.1
MAPGVASSRQVDCETRVADGSSSDAVVEQHAASANAAEGAHPPCERKREDAGTPSCSQSFT